MVMIMNVLFCHTEVMRLEEYKNDKEEWYKDLEDTSMDEEDDERPFSTDEDQ